MTVFYRDETALITSATVEFSGRHYELTELDYVWHRRTRRLARASYVLATRIGTVLVAVGCLVGGIVVLTVADFGRYTWPLLTGVALLVTALGAVAGFGVDPLLELLDRSHERGHGVHEIWARVAGEEILLLRTVDAFRFGKLYRSLQRALESAAPPR
ncbi:MAG: hypothetical protein HKP61_00530 [Dactylosporangium sp.]|nr:hypothetical protein [Dactylosporangium sp.]NNJ59457.1 hypothetical protein [Dactylosporangium sp.]